LHIQTANGGRDSQFGAGNFISAIFLLLAYYNKASNHTTTPQPFYGPFSGTIRVSQCQKRTSGLYGARED